MFWEVGKGRGPVSGHPRGWGKAQVPIAPGEAWADKLVYVQGPEWGPHMLSLKHVTTQQLPGQLALRQRCFEWEGQRPQVKFLGLEPWLLGRPSSQATPIVQAFSSHHDGPPAAPAPAGPPHAW